MNPHASPEPPRHRAGAAESPGNGALTEGPSRHVPPGGLPPDTVGSDDGGLSVIVKSVAVVGVLDAVAVGYFAGRGAGASAAFGATLGLANLLVLGRMVRAFLGRGGASMPWVVAALTKLAVLLLAMYLPVRAGLVQVLPFVIGFGALPLGIVLGQLLTVPPTSKEN